MLILLLFSAYRFISQSLEYPFGLASALIFCTDFLENAPPAFYNQKQEISALSAAKTSRAYR